MSEHVGKVFVVDDVLEESDDDATSFLEQALATPVRVDIVKIRLDSVALPNPDSMHHRQWHIFIHSLVA